MSRSQRVACRDQRCGIHRPWHFLNFRGFPHQQGSFLPTFPSTVAIPPARSVARPVRIWGLQEIEWVIWGVFCLSGKGWIEMEWSARRLVRQAIGRSGSDEAGGYVDDPLRGASALPPRSARWTPGSLGTRGNARLRPHTRRPCRNPDENRSRRRGRSRSRCALSARCEAQCRGSMQVRTLRRRYSSSRRP